MGIKKQLFENFAFPLQIRTIRRSEIGRVTGMSLTCNMLSGLTQRVVFHATVCSIVTKLHILSHGTLPLRAEVYVAGTRCSLLTNSRAVLGAVSRWSCSPGSRTDRSFEMAVMVDASLVSARTREPYFRGLHHLVFAVFGRQEFFSFDLERQRVTGVISAKTANDTRFWNTVFLPATMGVLGAALGLAPVDAACLDRNGRGLLIAGVSGAGKSTLAVAASQNGFDLVSDGWTYLARNGNDLTAYGLSVPVRLLPDAVRHFPELRNCRTGKALKGEMAFAADARRVFGVKMQRQSSPLCVLFLERVQQPGCDFVAYEQEEARRFFESSVECLPPQLADAAAQRSGTIRSLTDRPCWLLRTGESPQKTAEAVSRFFERI